MKTLIFLILFVFSASLFAGVVVPRLPETISLSESMRQRKELIHLLKTKPDTVSEEDVFAMYFGDKKEILLKNEMVGIPDNLFPPTAYDIVSNFSLKILVAGPDSLVWENTKVSEKSSQSYSNLSVLLLPGILFLGIFVIYFLFIQGIGSYFFRKILSIGAPLFMISTIWWLYFTGPGNLNFLVTCQLTGITIFSLLLAILINFFLKRRNKFRPRITGGGFSSGTRKN